MTEPTPEPPRRETLDYASPGSRPPKRARHILAITYAAVAIPVGLLFLVAGTAHVVRAVNENTSYEKRRDREAAFGFLASSTLLLGSGAWYLRAGLREL